ncbi:palmitoyl-protein thioesterase 1 [Glomus cerebriforme]|uniref:Palmitoyl-protein thioesterase 1 n=1 Tax=Glomus cerebriforme TaxID=658196 RepID=A0A397TT22_9GLOM|nr:palmitoyl-protein thioesterase 1 [Glomus cerebriforme]
MKCLSALLFLVSFFGYVQGSYRPVVLWHGMGDTCCGEESMVKVQQVINDTLPGIYTYSIMLGDNESQDKKLGFFGNINDEVEHVCEILKNDENLKDGFNAIGFSQGGQFLRAYVQRCNDPPVHNLITFGSQHAGISDIPGCSKDDRLCQLMRTIARRGAYSNYVRTRVIQAQYYKDPNHLDTYLQQNIFLPDINNELDNKNETYKMNLKSLNKLVLIRFTEDITVKPKDSAWFSFYSSEGDLLTLHQQPIYTEDWIGLKYLDKNGKLDFKDCEGAHMQIPLEYLRDEVIMPYLSFDTGDEENSNLYDNAFEQARKKLKLNIQE